MALPPDPLTYASYEEKTLLWQTLIHIMFLLSAASIAAVDRLMPVKRLDH